MSQVSSKKSSGGATQSRASRSPCTNTALNSTHCPSGKELLYERVKAEAESLVLPPRGPWKVVLLVDSRERQSDRVINKCKQSGIPCEDVTCRLETWRGLRGVVQHRRRRRRRRRRCCLLRRLKFLVGTILERKEVNDLSHSLYGTCLVEQRLRLANCGLPQIIYLVEGDLNSVLNCPAETLRMAMMESRMQWGFAVMQTKHLEETVQLLKGMHRRIVQRTFPTAFEELPTFTNSRSAVVSGRPRKRRRPSSLLELVFDTPPVPPFGSSRFTTYAELKAKVERDREVGTRTVGAIYRAMLKQVTSLSQKKCDAIARHYPTWSHLLQAFAANRGPAFVADVPCHQQKIGPKSAE